MRRWHADLLLLCAAAIWGLAFVFQKSAMSHVGAFTFIAARGALAALTLAPLAWLEWRRAAAAPDRAAAIALPVLARAGAIGGVLFFLGAALQQMGLVTATVTNTGFLTALYVVVTPLLVWLFEGRAPGLFVWIAVGLSFLGTWLLGGATLAGFTAGDLLVAISALFWASHVIATGRAGRLRSPVGFTAIQFATVAVLGAIGMLLFETVSLDGLIAAAPDIAYVGLLSSALTFTLLTVALQYAPAAEVAVIVSTETLFAALAAYLLLGERLTALGMVGAALILAATLLVQLGAASRG
ncbi:MAG: DMT family transporter [Hyphomicrobiaceae bacterium]